METTKSVVVDVKRKGSNWSANAARREEIMLQQPKETNAGPENFAEIKVIGQKTVVLVHLDRGKNKW